MQVRVQTYTGLPFTYEERGLEWRLLDITD